MTMGPVEIERKVRQHDNDITEIYQMLAHIQGVQGRHTMRLGELGAALGIVDSKVDAVDHKVDQLDAKVNGLEHKVDGLEQKVSEIDQKLDGLSSNFESLDTKMGIVLELLQSGPRG